MSLSSKRQKDGSTWSRKRLSKRESNRQVELYQDLSLPLDKFIKCLVKGDLPQLIIAGNPTTEELSDAWMRIYNMYLDENSNNEVEYIVQLQKQISILTQHVIEVQGCIVFLSYMFHEGLVEILKSNGYKDKVTEENHVMMAEIINNKLSLKRFTLDGKEKELKDYLEKHKDDEVDEKYFTRTLLRLGKFMGVHLKARELTVLEFVTLSKEYYEWVNINNAAFEEAQRKRRGG